MPMFDASIFKTRIHYSKIQRKDETIFLWLQVAGGQILLPILVLTILLSRNVHRNSVFINFCCSWIFSSIVYCLLVYRGRSDSKDLSVDSSGTECLVQAAFINGVMSLTACTTLGVVLQLSSSIYAVKKGFVVGTFRDRFFRRILLLSPYAVFTSFTVVSAVLGDRTARSFTSGASLLELKSQIPIWRSPAHYTALSYSMLPPFLRGLLCKC
ncbi:hypothetical protein SCHPADRAFT_433214 [Schizopora paradoxa]|uniref:Uncharacterized protein n=1 Tax=Schizopora paradoxa TaxID=27342 RepID=A0A0H2RRZ7_9AGAM|nr:hypothetical protein SCHPADRAFT_433214 [Schizopora paradoxa]